MDSVDECVEINTVDGPNSTASGDSSEREKASPKGEPTTTFSKDTDAYDEPIDTPKGAPTDEVEQPLPEDPNESNSSLDRTIASTCKICSHPATYTRKRAGRTALACHECSEVVHYPCSRLPAYMLYNLINTTKRYVCETCSATPENFLKDLISEDIKGIENSPLPVRESTEQVRQPNSSNDDRLICIEKKLQDVCDALEKYNIAAIADRIQSMFSNMKKVNNEFESNINTLTKTKNALEKFSTANPSPATSKNDFQPRIDEQREEIKSLKAAEILLHQSITEKDKLIATLSTDKQTHVTRIDELHTKNQSLSSQLDPLIHIEEEKISHQNNLEKFAEEIKRLNAVIFSLNTKQREDETALQLQNQSLREQLNMKQTFIDEIKESLKSGAGANRQQAQPSGTPASTHVPTSNEPVNEPKVLLFHDSLCRNVNESIMSREKVSVKKVWAPTPAQTRAEIDKIVDGELIDCIVVQALTREVGTTETTAFVNDVSETIDKCLTKTEKVVLSLIVDREDDVQARLKAKAANGLLQLKYVNKDQVTICDHFNLSHKRFRCSDKLHLSDPGRAKFANNLKYAIGESLGVQVQKKRQSHDDGYDSARGNRRSSHRHDRNRNRNERYSRYRDERYDMYDEYERD